MSAVETIDLIDDDDDVNDSSTSHAVSASAPVYEVIDSDEEPKPAAKQSATKRTKAKKRKTSEPSSSSSSGSSSSSSSSSSAASASSTAASVTTSANKEPDKAKKKPKTDDEKRVARLKKEYDSLQKERANLPNIDARPNDSAGKKKAVDDDTSFDWQNWTAELIGPDGTPYAGAIFKMTLKYPSDYPFKPPSVHFSTPIFHPNFSADGHICLDILQNAWSPALVRSAYLIVFHCFDVVFPLLTSFCCSHCHTEHHQIAVVHQLTLRRSKHCITTQLTGSWALQSEVESGECVVPPLCELAFLQSIQLTSNQLHLLQHSRHLTVKSRSGSSNIVRLSSLPRNQRRHEVADSPFDDLYISQCLQLQHSHLRNKYKLRSQHIMTPCSLHCSGVPQVLELDG